MFINAPEITEKKRKKTFNKKITIWYENDLAYLNEFDR